MTRVKLRDEITGSATLTVDGSERVLSYVRRPALYALCCAHCDRYFVMERWCNDNLTPGELVGTFTQTAADRGNGFWVSVCSYACADAVVKGGWRELPDYEAFARLDAALVRVELGLTTLVKYERELLAEWEALPDLDPLESLSRSAAGVIRRFEVGP